MDYAQAAYKLHMTSALLGWFKSYSAKRDGRKLLVGVDGKIDEAELDAFDKYLRDPWPNRKVPKGVTDELKREARGQCGCCPNPSNVLREAHIDRKDIELDYYCQHPHNLILLCPTCHERYDDAADKFVTNKVIKHCKDIVLSRMMANVKADIERARAIHTVTEDLKLQLRQGIGVLTITQAWDSKAKDFFDKMVVGSGVNQFPVAYGLGAKNAAELKDGLTFLSGALGPTEPVTSAVLDGYASQVGVTLEPIKGDQWEWSPAEGECSRCGNAAPIEHAVCAACEQIQYGLGDTESYKVEEGEDGNVMILVENARAEFEPFHCEECDSDQFSEVEYGTLCGYCNHMTGKDD